MVKDVLGPVFTAGCLEACLHLFWNLGCCFQTRNTGVCKSIQDMQSPYETSNKIPLGKKTPIAYFFLTGY